MVDLKDRNPIYVCPSMKIRTLHCLRTSSYNVKNELEVTFDYDLTEFHIRFRSTCVFFYNFSKYSKLRLYHNQGSIKQNTNNVSYRSSLDTLQPVNGSSYIPLLSFVNREISVSFSMVITLFAGLT